MKNKNNLITRVYSFQYSLHLKHKKTCNTDKNGTPNKNTPAIRKTHSHINQTVKGQIFTYH